VVVAAAKHRRELCFVGRSMLCNMGPAVELRFLERPTRSW
jgi:hypothetical protein